MPSARCAVGNANCRADFRELAKLLARLLYMQELAGRKMKNSIENLRRSIRERPKASRFARKTDPISFIDGLTMFFENLLIYYLIRQGWDVRPAAQMLCGRFSRLLARRVVEQQLPPKIAHTVGRASPCPPPEPNSSRRVGFSFGKATRA